MGRRLLVASGNVLLALTLMAFVWGDSRHLLLDPVRAAAAVLILVPTIVVTLFTANWQKRAR